jgi:hypothetical protein
MVTVNERHGGAAGLIREKMSHMLACYKGDWIYIGSISPSGNAEYWPLSRGYIGGGGGDVFNIANTDVNDIKFAEYPLGFGRHNGSLYYVARVPVRKNRFGLRGDNISFTPIGGVREQRDNTMFDQALHGHVLENILKGVHPSFQDARASIKAGAKDASFDRDFALVRATRYVANLYYKTDVCGEISLRDTYGELYPSFDHLQERLIYSCRVPKDFIQKAANV